MKELKKIVIIGINEKATRLEIKEAREIFAQICSNHKLVLEKLKLIGRALRSLAPEIDQDSLLYEIDRDKAFEFSIEWINNLLSPNYILSENQKLELEENPHTGNGAVIINKLTPLTSIDFAFNYIQESTKKLEGIYKIMYEKTKH